MRGVVGEVSGAVAIFWCLTAARGLQVALPPGGGRCGIIAARMWQLSLVKRMSTGLVGTVSCLRCNVHCVGNGKR